MVRHDLTIKSKQLLEARGRGDHGGSRVEDVPVFLVDVGPAPRLVPSLEDGGLEAHGLKADGRREPAKPTPHDRCASLLHCRSTSLHG